MDIGCGSSVIGDTSNDAGNIGTDEHMGINHPYNMFAWSDQFREHNPVLVDDGKGGRTLELQVFPRYYRLDVTSPGNFTFEACAAKSVCEPR